MFGRLAFGCASLLVSLAPALVTWLLMCAIAAPRQQGISSGRTPNPKPMSALVLGPVDMLVSADPWFAGTIVFWLLPGLCGLCFFAMFAAAAVRSPATAATPLIRRALPLLITSLLFGLIFAAPWYYGVYRLLLSVT